MNASATAERLLRGMRSGAMLTLGEHLDVHGPLPAARRGDAGALLDAVEHSGLRGRGGAHISTAMKLRAVAARRRRAIVVGNGAAGELQRDVATGRYFLKIANRRIDPIQPLFFNRLWERLT